MKSKLYTLLAVTAIAFLFYACANKAQGPTGGKKDITPPRVMQSTPRNGSLNFNKKEVEIIFDENISVEKPTENVVVSPPQIKMPDVKAYGHRVTVSFEDKLKDSTTYSIHFGNSIADLNEKNVLKNYLFSFSTGNQIDTLQIAGTVINAEDMNPMSNILVGIYYEGSDALFSSKPMVRIGKTDERGRFVIANVKKGRYKIFALDDNSRDYFYQPGEGLAFSDSVVTPTFIREQMHDTIWKDSTHVDSVHTYMGTHYLPDNLFLRFFKESKKKQFLIKSERKEPFNFSLFFNAPLTQLPQIKPLNFDWNNKYMLQKNNTRDSLTYWLTDSLVWKKDTLQMEVAYLKSDSLMKLVPTKDTLNVFMRKAKVTGRRQNKTTAPVKKVALQLTTNLNPSFDVYLPVVLKFNAPLAQINDKGIMLRQKVDSVYKILKYKWKQMDSTRMCYSMEYKWEPEASYELKIDSAVFTSIYDKVSNKLSSQFKIRSLDEYSSVKVTLAPFNAKAMLQILDSKDNLMATLPAKEKGTVFEYLKPGDYYLRMFIDANGNGKWDTGDLKSKLQPEEVIYYPKKFTLKANWEFEETWNYTQYPVSEQKAKEIKKDGNKKKSE